MLSFFGGESLSPSEPPSSPCNRFSFTVTLLKVLFLWKQKHSWLLTTLYWFDGSLGTEEQACFVGASEELTLGCCKKDKYQKILMSVTVLKAGRVPGGPPLCVLEEWRNALHHRHKSGWAWTFLVERDGDSISAWELFLNGCPNQLVCFSAINRNYHLD